jgi:hypothetical protein
LKLSVQTFNVINLSLRMGQKTFERKTVSRLMEHINEIEQENAPIIVPLKISQALNLCRCVMSRTSIIRNLDVVNQLFRDYDRNVLDALITIREYLKEDADNSETLLQALVKGYTADQIQSG